MKTTSAPDKNMLKIRGAIFDLDGTILDSMFIWDSIAERFLISEGRTPKDGLSEIISKMSMRQACESIRVDYDLPYSTDEIIEKAVALADDFYRYEAGLKPGVGDFVKKLYDRGVKMCIATADDKGLAEAALERCGIGYCFERIITCSEIGHGKDEPFIYREAADYLGFPKHKIMVFEDSFHALKTAADEGFATCAVYDEHEKEQELLKKTADLYCENWTGEKALCQLPRIMGFESPDTP